MQQYTARPFGRRYSTTHVLYTARHCCGLCSSLSVTPPALGTDRLPRTARAVRGRGSAGNTTNNITGALRCLTEWPGICDNKKNRRTVAASSGLPFVGLKTARPFLSLFMYAATIHLQNTTLLLFCQAVIFGAGGNCSETTRHTNVQRRFALVKPLTVWVPCGIISRPRRKLQRRRPALRKPAGNKPAGP